jgi:hypothetical protein
MKKKYVIFLGIVLLIILTGIFIEKTDDNHRPKNKVSYIFKKLDKKIGFTEDQKKQADIIIKQIVDYNKDKKKIYFKNFKNVMIKELNNDNINNLNVIEAFTKMQNERYDRDIFTLKKIIEFINQFDNNQKKELTEYIEKIYNKIESKHKE